MVLTNSSWVIFWRPFFSTTLNGEGKTSIDIKFCLIHLPCLQGQVRYALNSFKNTSFAWSFSSSLHPDSINRFLIFNFYQKKENQSNCCHQPEVLLQPLFLPGLHQSLLNCGLHRGIHGSQQSADLKGYKMHWGSRDLLIKAWYVPGQSDGAA